MEFWLKNLKSNGWLLDNTGFFSDESGATTVDWVVMSAAVAGLGVAVIVPIATGASDTSSGVSNLLTSIQVSSAFAEDVFFSGVSFFNFGIAAYPDSNNQAWATARAKVDAEAPDGFNYDPYLFETRYIDNASGNPIYVSDDGSQYSIGGQIIAVEDYDNSGRTSFYSAFNTYWSETQ